MNIRSLLFRSREKIEVKEFEMWEVRWTSRHGRYSADTRPELKSFPSKREAEEFKSALEDAFKLIRNTAENYVYLSKSS